MKRRIKIMDKTIKKTENYLKNLKAQRKGLLKAINPTVKNKNVNTKKTSKEGKFLLPRISYLEFFHLVFFFTA